MLSYQHRYHRPEIFYEFFTINSQLRFYRNDVQLTIHIRESKLAPRLTSVNMSSELGVYLNDTSSIWTIGGDNESVSGNFKITSGSFSIGFRSGLQKICNIDSINIHYDTTNRKVNLQFFQHFYFTLHTRCSVSVISKFIDELLYVLSLGLLSFDLALLIFQFFGLGFFKHFVITAITINSLK